MRAGLPRPIVIAIWVIGASLVHLVLPSLLARIGEQRTGWWSVAGAIAVLLGTAGLAWCVVLHVRHAPARTPVSTATTYLATDGPYAYSRNPMYVAELVLWTGWTLFLGSIPVAIGLALLWAGIALAVRWEEWSLEKLFGDDYLAYRSRVRRWL